jgi:hypothetical protein
VAGKAEAQRRKRIIHLKTAKALGIGLHHDIEEALANAGKDSPATISTRHFCTAACPRRE